MTRISLLAALACAGFVFLGACRETDQTELPKPVELTSQAVAHYCQMMVLEHPGPKAQVHLAGNPHPIWFTQIRDAVAFTLLPEETDEISAIYVTDMTETPWNTPTSATWIAAHEAFYVIESDREGGMGAPEAVPFADRDKARDFVSRHGGRIVGFKQIPKEYVLAPVDLPDISVEAEG